MTRDRPTEVTEWGTRIDGSAIDKVLEEAVGTGAVPHVAAIAADRDGVIYEGGAGVRIAGESDDPVTAATQFRIMSMTKMVCTAAALQQVERGELDLDAPVDTYVPAFADLQVLDGFDGNDTPRLRRPGEPGDGPEPRDAHRRARVLVLGRRPDALRAGHRTAERRARLRRGVQGPAGRRPRYAASTYGINTDWLGRVVEAVAGTTLDVVVKEKITGPLGMGDTMFRLDEQRSANCVTVHVPGEDGNWVSAGEILNQSPDWWAGGHGLYSTPRDYIRFERMLLRGGELDGERILTQETVDAAFTNQIGDLDFPAEIPTADPPITASSTPARAGSGATACC